MSRIFFTLSVVALAIMAGATVVGLGLGDLNAQLLAGKNVAARIRELQRRAEPTTDEQAGLAAARRQMDQFAALQVRGRLHMLLGVAAALVVILVNSIAITYFIGTSRWCREVVEAYDLDPQLAEQAQRLKRRSFPWAIAGMLTVLAVSALGAAADPGTLRPNTQWWVLPHRIAALAGLVLIGGSFFALWLNIADNHRVIDHAVAEVGRIRRERGLPV